MSNNYSHSEADVCLNVNRGGLVGCGLKSGKQMYTTAVQNKYCENVQSLLFTIIPRISMVFLQVVFVSV